MASNAAQLVASSSRAAAPEAHRVATGDHHVGPLGTGTACRLVPHAHAPTDDDHELADQLGGPVGTAVTVASLMEPPRSRQCEQRSRRIGVAVNRPSRPRAPTASVSGRRAAADGSTITEVAMPWFPDFVAAAELARREIGDAGHADPVAQYLTALMQW